MNGRAEASLASCIAWKLMLAKVLKHSSGGSESVLRTLCPTQASTKGLGEFVFSSARISISYIHTLKIVHG
ncbi:hypothetical protein PanWU01x14_087220 [Parasponia andersonii]|uniref:Uncharacterized protein n=1 Tax=Parasponia andersonii TaxID=3476 RepID=A0A2P5D8G2_PARAD|nr:hypothetical protein PanWU01x14_087220 [Parasponia andersonii]